MGSSAGMGASSSALPPSQKLSHATTSPSIAWDRRGVVVCRSLEPWSHHGTSDITQKTGWHPFVPSLLP